MKIYGPYTRKDGRKHICIVHSDGRKQTKSYPRYVLEQHLGRELSKEETVDHIDNDFTNDSIDNLQILSLTDNILKQQDLNPRKMYTYNCPNCGKECTKVFNHIKSNWNKGRGGPYCSRSCAGQATYVNPWRNHNE